MNTPRQGSAPDRGRQGELARAEGTVRSRIREAATLAGKLADAGYAAAEQVLTEAGNELVNRRPLASLQVARFKRPDGTICANAAALPGAAAMVTRALSSEGLGEVEPRPGTEELLRQITR